MDDVLDRVALTPDSVAAWLALCRRLVESGSVPDGELPDEAAGFDAVEYDDCLPGTADTFTCTRVFVPGKLSVYAIEMVEEVA